MQAQIDRISPVLVQVAVDVPWKELSSRVEEAYRALQRSARVRGFRPGKVPRSVIKNMMGESLHRQVTGPLVEAQLAQVMDEQSIEPVTMTELDTPPIVEGKDYRFTAKLEVKPTIESVDTSQLSVERPLEPVTDEMIEREVEGLRQQHAELRAPEPARPAQAGDVLTFDIEVEVDGTAQPELGSTNTRAELGREQLLEPLEQGMLGASAGETRSIEHKFAEDYEHEPLRGKPATFKVHVKEIQEKVLPELDDDFARDLEHESLSALREHVRGQLQGQADRKASALVNDALVEKLIDDNPVEVPPSLVAEQQRQMLSEIYQLQQALGRQLPLGDDFWSGFEQRAARKVRAGLLLGAVAKQNQIAVTDADIDARIEAMAQETGKHVAKVRAEYQGERRDGLRRQLLERKLLEYLASQATITDVAKTPTEATPESPPDPAT